MAHKSFTSDLSIPVSGATTWLLLDAEGPVPETLQNTWGRIYSEWFPEAEYELSEGPEILWNEDMNTRSPNIKSEIRIPVKKQM